MKNTFLIRKATVNDAEDIKCILNESFEKYVKVAGIAGTVEALEESVEDIIRDIGYKEVFIAFMDGEPAGSIRAELLQDNTAYITRFGVRPKFHNMGIGTGLISMVDELLKSIGISEARLYTASNYQDLMRFYYSKGFFAESISYDRGYPRACMVKKYPLK